MLQKLILTIFIFLSISCGGGSHEPREEKSLYFIDLPVNGIEYRCGERQGLSKSNETSHGVITCVYSPLSLYLGILKLGEIENFVDGQKIYPQTLVPSFDGDFNNQEVLKIAILLQSLDDNSSSEYINIPKSTKEKISITSLKNLTINELYEEIKKMGITPVNKEKARIHLILNSPNTNVGKPTIEAFEEDISVSSMVGSVIVKLSIDKGDGTLISPLILLGEGKEYFTLNDNGSLQLIKSLDNPAIYKLKIIASNEFGYTTQTITIYVQDSDKIGKAQMGRLSDSTVKIFQLNKDGTKELISTTQTKSIGSLNQIGNFELKPELLEDHKFYIYEVSEGIDIDPNDNGIVDDNSSINNSGKLRLISKGIWIKNSMYKIRVTPLSEMLYNYVTEYCHYDKLEEKLSEYAQILLKKSLDNDNDIDAKDIMIFNPLKDKKWLYPTLKYNNIYQTLVDKIRVGDEQYKSTLFNANIIESFNSNAIEIVGSYIYTIDMMGSGEFRIYDLETKKMISSFKLPNTPFYNDNHVIYINLLGNSARISSLEEWSYIIDIKNQKKPFLIKDPFVMDSILSGNFSRMALGRSNSQNLFSKERAIYFYDISLDEGETKKIKFFNTNKNNDIFKYEFDSELLTIDSLWSYKKYLYVIGDNKIHIFIEENNQMRLYSIYDSLKIQGNILGVEKDILYILNKRELTLIDITSNTHPKFIEKLFVPFDYKLGVKTNGEYITTGSQIIDIKTLRAASIKNAKLHQLIE